MKHFRYLLFFLILSSILYSDEFVVKSFQYDQSDLSARVNDKRDVNGDLCAIIKVRTGLNNLNFHSNQLSDMVHKTGEYWLYVSPGIQYIEILKEGFSRLGYQIPETIESQNTYIMRLTQKGAGGRVDEDLLKLSFKFNTDNVYVNREGFAPVQASGSSAVFRLPEGKYDFTFSKNGYKDKTQTITLTEDQTIDINLEPGSSQTTFKAPGIVTITSDPSGAEVFINNQQKGVTPYTDQLIAGEYQVRLEKDLYHSQVSNFILSEGESVEIPEIELKPKFAYVAIQTNPANAMVYLDGTRLGKAPIQRRKIESGTHDLRIEKDMYHTYEKSINLQDGDDKTLTPQLKPAFGELVIKSEPKNATIYIDGQMVGQTPYRNDRQPSRTYTVRVTKSLWLPAEEEITVSDGETTNKTIVLTRNFGTLNISAPKSNIYINNDRIGTGRVERKLKPGNYNITATRAKHYDASRDIFLRNGDNKDITLEPQPKIGSVSVISKPTDRTMGSKIYVNNERVPDKTTPAVLPLLIGDYSITLRHPEFLEATKQITLQENQQKKLIFNLQTYQGSMLQKEKSWNKKKWLSFGSTALMLCAGVACNYLGDQSYDDYQNAADNSAASQSWNDTNLYYNVRDITYSVSLAPLIYGVYSWAKQVHFKNKRVGR